MSKYKKCSSQSEQWQAQIHPKKNTPPHTHTHPDKCLVNEQTARSLLHHDPSEPCGPFQTGCMQKKEKKKRKGTWCTFKAFVHPAKWGEKKNKTTRKTPNSVAILQSYFSHLYIHAFTYQNLYHFSHFQLNVQLLLNAKYRELRLR